MSIVQITMVICLHCTREIDATKEENYNVEAWEVYCPYCGYTNELNDPRVQWEEHDITP